MGKMCNVKKAEMLKTVDEGKGAERRRSEVRPAGRACRGKSVRSVIEKVRWMRCDAMAARGLFLMRRLARKLT